MPADLVKLEQKTDPREVIATLTELLKRAKEGEFESFIAMCVRPDRTFFTRSSGYKNSLEMIGALQCAVHDVIVGSER